MHGARSHVRNHHRGVRSDLTLEVYVPLHHVITLGILFDVSSTLRSRPLRPGRWDHWVWEGARRQFGGIERLSKGICSNAAAQVRRQNLHIEHSESPADSGLAIFKRIP